MKAAGASGGRLLTAMSGAGVVCGRRADVVWTLCRPACSATDPGRIGFMYVIQSAPAGEPRMRVRTVAVPLGSAAVLAAAATFLEARTVGYAWSRCDVGV